MAKRKRNCEWPKIPPQIMLEHCGSVICDLVGHVARTFHLAEEDVWERVDRERHDPTPVIDVAWFKVPVN
jgi:hypothetical protein